MFLTDAAHPTPHPSRFARHLPLKGKAFGLCEALLHSKSQRLEPLASNIGLLALVHSTHLTGGYDSFALFYNFADVNFALIAKVVFENVIEGSVLVNFVGTVLTVILGLLV